MLTNGHPVTSQANVLTGYGSYQPPAPLQSQPTVVPGLTTQAVAINGQPTAVPGLVSQPTAVPGLNVQPGAMPITAQAAPVNGVDNQLAFVPSGLVNQPSAASGTMIAVNQPGAAVNHQFGQPALTQSMNSFPSQNVAVVKPLSKTELKKLQWQKERGEGAAIAYMFVIKVTC